jgi:hypothetical protein
MFQYIKNILKDCFSTEKDLTIFENLPMDIVHKILEFDGKILYENGKYINQIPQNDSFNHYRINYNYILVDRTPRPIMMIF